MSQDFASLLNVWADEVRELPLLPMGQYLAWVGQYELKNIKGKDGKEFPVAEIPLRLSSALNVSDGVEMPPKLPELKHNFFLVNAEGQQDDFTLDQLKKFVEACGIGTAGRKMGELLQETVGQQVVVNIVHIPNKNNPLRPYANIRGFAQA